MPRLTFWFLVFAAGINIGFAYRSSSWWISIGVAILLLVVAVYQAVVYHRIRRDLLDRKRKTRADIGP